MSGLTALLIGTGVLTALFVLAAPGAEDSDMQLVMAIASAIAFGAAYYTATL